MILSLLAAAALGSAAQAAHVRRVETLVAPLGKGKGVEVMAEEALVRFDDKTPAAGRLAALKDAGMSVDRQVGGGPWQLVFMPAGTPVASGLTVLKALPGVIEAQPNRAYRALRTPNDPQVSSQWHLSNVNAFAGWEYETGASHPVTIAVMDTGIQGDHPDLAANIDAAHSQDCSSGACVTENPPTPACDHGTRVAGVAAAVANNAVGVAGMSWSAKLVSLKVIPNGACTPDCGGAGCAATDASIIAALNYAQGLAGPVIANMSLGGCGACSAAVGSAISSAYAAGVTLIAAAGNGDCPGLVVENPANCTNVIPVGATDQSNTVASFSSRGPELAANGLVAPGVSIVTTDINSGYTSNATGTSFATPLVAGLAALIRSAKPAFTPAQVQATLRNSASNIGVSALGLKPGISPLGDTAGAGLANAYGAMRLTITGSTQFDGTTKAIAFPNPFHPSKDGIVTLTVPTDLQGANPSIKVYTLAGQFVRDLHGGDTWDGKNDEGMPVATGTYVFLISSDKGRTRGRVAVIR